MPIVTAAITAIAAVASTVAAGAGIAATGAALATAAVNVGTLVGVVGVGMTIAGAVTKNPTISKIGGYLGMAGGAMGLVGGLAGGMAGAMKNLSSAWDDGVGSLFSTKSVGAAGLEQEALGRGIVQATNPDAASHFAQTGQQFSTPELQGAITRGMTTAARTPAATATLPSPDLSLEQMSQFVTPDDVVGAARANSIQALANADNATNLAPSATMAPTAPSAPSSITPSTAAAAIGPAAPTVASVGQQAASSSSGVSSIFGNLPDWAKAQIAISGVQGLSGMLGGWFESSSEEEKLEMQREAQRWQQQHADKDQAFVQRNQSYAPKLEFAGASSPSTGGGALTRKRV